MLAPDSNAKHRANPFHEVLTNPKIVIVVEPALGDCCVVRLGKQPQVSLIRKYRSLSGQSLDYFGREFPGSNQSG